MKTFLTGCAVAALLTSSALAAPVYEVLRVGDSEKTCEVLTGEINALNAEVAELNAKATKKAAAAKSGKALGKGLLSGLAQAAPMLGSYGGFGNNGMASMIASQAASGVAQQALTSAANAPEAPAEAAAPQITPQQQRLTHLMGIYRAKPC